MRFVLATESSEETILFIEGKPNFVSHRGRPPYHVKRERWKV